MEAFGQDKSARFGEETCGTAELRLRADDDDDDKKRDALNEVQTQQVMKARQRMREYFDLYYYNLKVTNAEEAKGPFKQPRDANKQEISHLGRFSRLVYQVEEFTLHLARPFQSLSIVFWSPIIDRTWAGPSLSRFRSVWSRTRSLVRKI